ncbi:MAG: hypothetical protein ACRC42_04980 [Mycoplasma sp.]
MSQIKFFAISGMDERSRHCYVLEIENDIYVFNSGVENLITQSLGVSKIVPDLTYLVENKNRIRAIVVGTANTSNIGAIDLLLSKLGTGIPIITNEVARTIIDTHLASRYWQQSQRDEIKYIVVSPMRDLVLENGQTIVPFRIANSMPGSVGFVFKTPAGCIVYLDNYIIVNDQTKAFYSQLANIRDIIKGIPVLLMITQTGIVEKSIGFTAPHHNNKEFFDNIVSNTNKRIFVALHDNDAYSIFNLAQTAKKYQKNFIIYSRSFINTFQATIKTGLFNNKGLLSVPLGKLKDVSNAIIVISGEPEKLYDKIYKIIDGEDDSVSFKQDDTFVLATKLIPGYEGHTSKMLDRISQLDIKTIIAPKSFLPLEPSNEDHKFTASLIQPKYIIPVGGLYKTFVHYQNIINQTWLKRDQVLILANGEVAQFNNGNYTPVKKRLPADTVQMSSFGGTDISDSVLYERNQMLENGSVCISFIVNEKMMIVSDVEIFDYGVFNHNDTKILNIYQEIKKEIQNNIYSCFVYRNNNSIDFKETKILIKKSIAKLMDKKLNKRPIILSTIIELKGSSNAKQNRN